MELINRTLAAARLFTGFTNPTSGVAALVARRTYRLDEDGALVPSDEPWPIFAEPLRTDVGTFPTDMTPAHAGCDLVIAGVARSAEPVTSLQVSASVGAFSTRIALFGQGYAFFDMSHGKRYQGKVTPEGLEAFRVALLKANLCGGKFGVNPQWSLDIESKLSAVRCSVHVSEMRGVKSPRVRAIRDAFADLQENACHGRCPDLGGTY